MADQVNEVRLMEGKDLGPSTQPNSPIEYPAEGTLTCTFDHRQYSPGSVICNLGLKMQCNGNTGRWVRIGECDLESESHGASEVPVDPAAQPIIRLAVISGTGSLGGSVSVVSPGTNRNGSERIGPRREAGSCATAMYVAASEAQVRATITYERDRPLVPIVNFFSRDQGLRVNNAGFLVERV